MKFTYTSLFVFPLLGIPKRLFGVSKYAKGRHIGTRFVNAYLCQEGINTPINSICVVYSNFMDKDQAAFQDTLEVSHCAMIMYLEIWTSWSLFFKVYF